MSEEQLNGLHIWNEVSQPDVRHVKSFTRKGGFSGKAINGTYNHMQATKLFGPMGIGWGVEIVEERWQEGGLMLLKDTSNKLMLDKDGRPFPLGNSVVHVLRIKLWYVDPETGIRGEVYNYGQTEFVFQNSKGEVVTDEEAPKKSMTDAVAKALSNLGFNAEIHMGLWDDNKYLNRVKAEQEAQQQAEEQRAPRKQTKTVPTPTTPAATVTVPTTQADAEEAKDEAATVPAEEPQNEQPEVAVSEPAMVLTWTDIIEAVNQLSPGLRTVVSPQLAAIAAKYGAKRLADASQAAWQEAYALVNQAVKEEAA